MKTINFFVKMIAASAFVLLINPVDSMAQKQKSPAKAKTDAAAQVNDVGPVRVQCDDLISKTYADLETMATKTCSSTRTTVQCNDRKTGKPVYVTLIARPSGNGCQTSVKVTDNAVAELSPKSRGGSDATAGKPASFDVEIMERQCPTGGVKLSAYIPGDNDTKGQYTFDWKAKERSIDSDEEVECTTERDITLTVTDKVSKQVVSKRVTLDVRADVRKN